MINRWDSPPDDFVEQVQESLLHLYDINLLRQSVLVKSLVPNEPGIEMAKQYRLIVQALIASLKPLGDSSMYSRQARVYNILQLHYIEGQTHSEVIDQLAVGDSQYYREHRRALEAISALMWERIQERSQESQTEDTVQDISIESELHRVQQASELATVDLDILLTEAIHIVRPLVDGRQILIKLGSDGYTQNSYINPSIARQLIVVLIDQLTTYMTQQGNLNVSCIAGVPDNIIRFSSNDYRIEQRDLVEALANNETISYLSENLHVQLKFSDDPSAPMNLTMVIPTQQQKILIIDDNPDLVRLIGHYLSGYSYQCIKAVNGQKGIELAHEAHPALIILDVMMPDMDGWQVLHTLKSHPATKDIPVLVCSVLDISQIALSLGANGYLKKPPDPRDLVKFLNA